MVNLRNARADFPKDTAPSRPHGTKGGERKVKHRVPTEFAGAAGGGASESVAEDFGFLKQDDIVRHVRKDKQGSRFPRVSVGGEHQPQTELAPGRIG